MSVDWTFLRSRVARRLFLLFLLCALLPIGALGLLSLSEVNAQLRLQREDRLAELSRAHAMTVFERVNLLHAQLRAWAADREIGEQLPAGFVTAAEGSETSVVLQGRTLSWQLTPELVLVLDRREPLLVTALEENDERGERRLLVGVRSPGGGMERTVTWGEVAPLYLWWGPTREKTLTLTQELHVFDDGLANIYSSSGTPVTFPEALRPDRGTGVAPNRGVFDWQDRGEGYLAGMSRLPPHYGGLAIAISEPLSELLAPVRTFKRQFLLVLLATLLTVLLASLSQIRRSLDPLEKLQDGTRRIARRDFETPVRISSGDEFEELAGSFNQMSSTLARQFATLTTMRDIGHSVLSKLAADGVVTAALDRIGEVLPLEAASITLFEVEEGTPRARSWFRLIGQRAEVVPLSAPLGPGELESLDAVAQWAHLPRGSSLPAWIAPFESVGAGVHVLPIRLDGELRGAVCLGHPPAADLGDEDLERARQLADQIAVGLSNSRLVGDLEQLSHGTLVALARAVDTKSPWTRGHSERVAEGGRRLGRILGLDTEEQELLYRGGMLHDIGKIGVPSAILDKPGKLTEEETRLMRSHVEKGARILEPIPGFDEVLPIVWEHHERFDGRGYPKGLRDEEISLHGRIFAVADVFDAIRSPRPYRGAVDFEHVVSMIRLGSGTEFDPEVVEAFLEVAEEIDRHCWGGELAAPVTDETISDRAVSDQAISG